MQYIKNSCIYIYICIYSYSASGTDLLRYGLESAKSAQRLRYGAVAVRNSVNGAEFGERYGIWPTVQNPANVTEQLP